METKGFSQTLLQDLRSNLVETKSKFSLVSLDKLITSIDSYQIDNNTSYPEIMKDLRSLIDSLSNVPRDNARTISKIARECCRECMFHADDCFINIVFLVFKSVELGTYLEPNKLRPTLRMESAQILMKQISDSIKQRNKS